MILIYEIVSEGLVVCNSVLCHFGAKAKEIVAMKYQSS